MEIHEVAEGRALTDLRDEWNSLLARCEQATIYQTWEWNEAWWRAFGRGKRLRLLTIRHNGTLAGLAPLYVSWHYNTPLRRLAFLGTGVSDYLDVIAPNDAAQDVCAAVLRHLERHRGFDLADLQQLRPDANLQRVAVRHPELARRHTLVAQEPCPYLSLPQAWDEYASRLGKKMRSNLGYYDRLLQRSFAEVEVGLASDYQLEPAMDALFLLHQQRWNARLLPGVLGSAPIQGFHREIARRFQKAGWLRLHTITADGRLAAALYCFCHRARTYYYLGGFAPDHAKLSLGTVLTARAIKQAIEEGCTEFDFLRGHEPYKYRWMPEERINHRLLLPRARSTRARAMLTLNRLEQTVERHAKAFAESRGRKRPTGRPTDAQQA